MTTCEHEPRIVISATGTYLARIYGQAPSCGWVTHGILGSDELVTRWNCLHALECSRCHTMLRTFLGEDCPDHPYGYSDG